jgi:alkylhydroperoxidase/carboxymuconolactone decarboxylase family protein YurZ
LVERTSTKNFPPTLRRFIKKYPKVWSAHERLGIEVTKAGPLKARDIQLIKLAASAGLGLETSFKTHVKKALRTGVSRAEIEHTILQLLPMLGLTKTMMAMKWYAQCQKD